MRALAGCLAAIILSTVPLCGAFAATQKSTPPASEEGTTTPAKIHELLNLLADPKVQEWLEKQGEAKSATGAAQETVSNSVSHYFDSRVGAIRGHIVALTAAIPDLPNQFGRAVGLVSADLGDRGRIKVLLLLAVFVGLGFGIEWLFRKATERMRRRLDEHPLETVKDRLRVIATRLAFAVGLVAAFALGSIGAFLALDWPPFLREIVFGYLAVFLQLTNCADAANAPLEGLTSGEGEHVIFGEPTHIGIQHHFALQANPDRPRLNLLSSAPGYAGPARPAPTGSSCAREMHACAGSMPLDSRRAPHANLCLIQDTSNIMFTANQISNTYKSDLPGLLDDHIYFGRFRPSGSFGLAGPTCRIAAVGWSSRLLKHC